MRMTLVSLLLFAGMLGTASSVSSPGDRKGEVLGGRRFIGIRDFRKWTAVGTGSPLLAVYTSPDIAAGFEWNELIVSWNVPASATRYLKVEVQAILANRSTRWYTLGLWSEQPAVHPRESVKNQKDADGDVETDTLALSHPADCVRLRLTMGGADERETGPPDFLGLSFCDTKSETHDTLTRKRGAPPCLEVPERSQLSYAGGKVWCCPTCTSMVLAYWSKKLGRPELDRDVPLVANGVFDPNWPGTGNWPFNTACAGSLPGMRAYVTRLAGMAEIEEWLRAGVPVVCSVSYRLLHGKSNAETGGHVVVVVGFTADGDVIVHDPWAEPGERVRITVPRKNMAAAWAKSHNTVFLIYPVMLRTPSNRAGHWD